MHPRRQLIAIIALLFFLPLVQFWAQTAGGRTLLPTENLYQYEPFATYREAVGAPEIPHNALLSDLVLQNVQWKAFIRQQLADGEIPLWNPHQFAGTPFMAAGQQSTLYPLSVLYYLMPLPAAYGWFTVMNLWLAGVFMFMLAGGLGVSRFGATLSGITYQLCGMFVASAVHPMIIGAVVWLPLLLLMAEYLIRQRPVRGQSATVPWVIGGALALACNILAGHPEIMIYSLLIAGYYSAVRLGALAWAGRFSRAALATVTTRGAWLLAMVALGLGAGAIQLIPLYEFVSTNWRAERSSLEAVLGFAHPARDLVQFILPNFYGSPAQHQYFDVFSGAMRAVDWVNADGARVVHTDWGIKNYVEAALYVGVLPLALAAFAVWTSIRATDKRLLVMAFAVLGVVSLTFAFGLPTYALIYGLPGINQLNTAFRWIFGVTVAVAVLAGMGADALSERPAAARRLGWAVAVAGALTLAGLLLSRAFYPLIAPLMEAAVNRLAKASSAFETPEMFYSVQFVNVLILGGVLATGGAAVIGLARGIRGARAFTVAVVAADLLIASWGFNPASDPRLLDFTPPAVEWLMARDDPGEWRYAVLNGNGRDILPPNSTLRYGLDDVRGYDSIISAQYVDYMRGVTPQNLLDFNQIAPLYVWDDVGAVIASPRFNQLNVRYVLAHRGVTLEGLTRVYEDEALSIWENPNALPRAYTLINESGLDADTPVTDAVPASILRQTSRELLVGLDVPQAGAWLVVSQSYAPGWRAYIRPVDGDERDERELPVERVQGNFQGVRLPDAGAWAVRLIYSPASFQVGAFATVMSLAIGLFLAGTWAWRRVVAPADDATSGAGRLARNSVVPILLNLFNRGIDFVFAFIMFRILGPEDAGFYYYAIVIFGWFDIFTNFGLDVYLMREAGRARGRAGVLFANTSALRFLLVVAAIPALMGFLTIRQASAEPLNADVLLTIALFYFGLVPGSLSKGLTSLFYAYERAEYPAVVTTLTTISRVLLGVGALLLGYGIVGLAAVSILTNIVTLGALGAGARRLGVAWAWHKPELPLMRGMVGNSWALMLNHFLATIFFQIDIVILEWVRNARTVGLYRVAYSWLLAINVVPAFFTQALLPVMSRQASENRDALRQTYTLGIKLLTMIAYPLAVVFTFLAEPLTWILGGSAYLPDGAIALQIMIWSIPIGWMNSLTQYALIALDLQRRITVAFIVAVTFNITANLILIPQYGYQAAAVTTILSEIVLLIPFARLMEGALGKLDWLGMFWRPALASGVMALVIGVGWQAGALLAVVVGCAVYPAVLLALKPFDAVELSRLSPVLPARARRLIGVPQ